jgi:flagellum-specific ATP synthase
MLDYDKLTETVCLTATTRHKGYVTAVTGLIIEARGPRAKMGEMVIIDTGMELIPAEVVGFDRNKTKLMVLGNQKGISPGNVILATGHTMRVKVGPNIVGRVLDGMGEPMDEEGPLEWEVIYPLEEKPPHPLRRQRVLDALPLGVRVMDALLTVGAGQRMGIFSGSGVGKSTLLGMIARNSQADVNVVGLVGERGREVREFIENDLGEEGLKRSVVVVATSDQPALVRKKAAFLATAVAEYFRDLGKNVILMMDSVTRFAMAQREVGLATGEPPATKGYTPSVFAELPKLLERSGTSEKGSITGLYTVLVDGDDVNEPISDAVRGILDGHVILSRQLASLGHYPAVDVLGSISRVMINIVQETHNQAASDVKALLAVYQEAKDLIDVGAYQMGSNPRIDLAIRYWDEINTYLRQNIHDVWNYEDTVSELLRIHERIST